MFKNPNLSETTIKNYTSRINSLLKGYLKTKDLKESDFKNIKSASTKIVKYIDGLEQATATKKLTYTALYVYARDNELPKKVQDLYNKKMLELRDINEEQRSKNEKSENAKENWISYNDLTKIVNEIPEDNAMNMRDKVIIALYTLQPPLRNDYIDVKIYKKSVNKPTENYVVYNKRWKILRFYLNHYKTLSQYGAKVFDWAVNDELYNIISRWIDNYKPKYLIPKISKRSNTIKNASVSETEMSALIPEVFNRYVKKYLNIQLLRQIYETELMTSDKYCKEMTQAQRNELHDKLLHDFITAQQYRRI